MSLHENIDTTTAAGKPVVHLFAVLAEFATSLIGECTKVGLAAALGWKGGRKRSLAKRDAQKAAIRQGVSLAGVVFCYGWCDGCSIGEDGGTVR